MQVIMGSKNNYLFNSAFINGFSSVFDLGSFISPIKFDLQFSNTIPTIHEIDLSKYFGKTFNYLATSMVNYGKEQTQAK
jgi:hypothetical protein